MKKFLAILFFGTQVSASSLFYLDDSAGKCIAKIIELPSKKESELFSSKTCPTAIVWLEEAKVLYFSDGTTLWTKALDSSMPAKEVAKLPNEETKLWFEKDSLNPRMAVFQKLNRDSFYAARAHELKNGEWVKLEEKTTEADEDDGFDYGVLETYKKRNVQGVYLESLLTDTTCVGTKLNCHSEEAIIATALGEQEGYGAARLRNGFDFVFSVLYGDTPHATFPVVLCKDKCKTKIDILDKAAREDLGIQLSIASDKDFILIAREYENSSPRVVDSASGKIILHLPKAKSATWFPSKAI